MNKRKIKGVNISHAGLKRLLRITVFPLAMVFIYFVLALFSPEHAMQAVTASSRVLIQIAPALGIAFVVMVIINMLVKPSHIARFLGNETKIKGTLLSSAAGIISMGPIYVWYPLLKEFRDKNTSDFHLANFLGCRAVKIPLMPIMAAYFGWVFTLILSILMIFGALLTGLLVSNLKGRYIKM